jgi:2-keto-3-deoxy-L-rhamnonate aldolase RhmA
MKPHLGCWLACPDVVFIEIARDIGFHTLVMDVEHGTFSLADLDKLVPYARALGLRVLVKVEGPRAEPIQQALDFGAHGVIIPHILGADHARGVCAAAKYPTLGTRSYAGARTVRYGVPADTYFDDDNRATARISRRSSRCRRSTASSWARRTCLSQPDVGATGSPTRTVRRSSASRPVARREASRG